MSELKRPEMKLADTKVSEKDFIYFSLGLSAEDYVLPSERSDYRSDARAVQLVQDIRAGKDLSGRDFSGINLKNADISGGKLAGASFRGALFYQTNAHQADFRDCDFTEAYFEKSDFSEAHLTGAIFAKTYLRDLTTDDADMDEDLRNRLLTMDFLIKQIESGALDIHCLTRSELMCLDLRRLDLSKVDLSGLDLSMFELEGVNLRGVYINPLQKLSMDQWQKDLAAVEQLQEKKLKEQVLKTLKQERQALDTYAADQATVAPVKSRHLTRPAPKRDEFEKLTPPPKKQEETKPDMPSDHMMKPHRAGGQAPILPPKTKKNKNRI